MEFNEAQPEQQICKYQKKFLLPYL